MREGIGLALHAVSAGYGSGDIIRDVGFEAAPGRVTTIAGPNGAGKSTLMKTVVGLLRPRTGRVLLGDRDVTRLDTPRRAGAGLGYVPQETNVFRNLSVTENLRIGLEFIRPSASRTDWQEARDRVLALFPDLSPRLGDLAGTLSGGQRQMLAIGAALMPGPSVLLLDEPSAGLSPRYVGVVLEAVRAVNAAGVTVLMIEQNLVEAVPASDDVVLLVAGEIRGVWKATRFLTDPTVKSLFLGQANPQHGTSGGRLGAGAT
jgi:ABC-type branched-subunit amino acid transport system ATPase component